MEGPARRLQQAALELAGEALPVHHLSRVRGYHRPSKVHHGGIVHVDFEGHRRVSLAVLVAREGKALSDTGSSWLTPPGECVRRCLQHPARPLVLQV